MSQDFFAEDECYSITPSVRRQKIEDEQVPAIDQALLLCQEGLDLTEKGYYQEAIACYDRAIAIQPGFYQVWYNRGWALFELGRYQAAVGSYNKAIEWNPDYYEAFAEKGYALSLLGRHQEALTSCDQALKIKPDYYKSWVRRSYILGRLNRLKQALISCDRALEIQPDSYEAWSNRGIILGLSGRRLEAIASLEKSLEIQPEHYKAWYNRGLFLAKLGRPEAALASFQKALEVRPNSQEFWLPQAWYGCGFMLARLGRYEEAIACFEKCLELKPDRAAAALYKFIILIITGKIINYLGNYQQRNKLLKELFNFVNAIKYHLLFLVGLTLIINDLDTTWMNALKEGFSVFFSIAIVCMIMAELWKNRANLSWVLKIYFKSGILTYVRAFCIVFITLTTFATVAPIVPSFLQWGWGSAVFGNAGNIIFQPFDTIKKIKPLPAKDTIQSFDAREISYPVIEETFQPSEAVTKSSKSQGVSFDYSTILIVVFWLFLILIVPFWARVEEKIFRKGANSWNQIMNRSCVFGLVHIGVGIPIFAGLILIIPGFLFACRYKYAHDQYFKKTHNEKMAQEVGVEASTADHAVYNAILITLLVAVMLLSND